jgi:DNA repair exonuclease SbcCD ATPase subunit
MVDKEQNLEVIETKESIWPKIWKFIIEAWEWIVAVLVIVTGWFLIQRWLNKPTKPEQELLNDIQHHEQEVNQLQGQVQSNIQHEQELAQQQQQIDQQIDQLYTDYDQHQQQFQQQEQQIHQESQNHQANIDYLNNKYKKK